MFAVSRVTDTVASPTGTGWKCLMPTTTVIVGPGTPTVLVNYLPIAGSGDAVMPHLGAFCHPDISFIIGTGFTVLAGYRPVATIGDEAFGSDLPNFIIRGSFNVLVG
jgi:uncharacterized Zn-binding protein involved in type VI secretion